MGRIHKLTAVVKGREVAFQITQLVPVHLLKIFKMSYQFCVLAVLVAQIDVQHQAGQSSDEPSSLHVMHHADGKTCKGSHKADDFACGIRQAQPASLGHLTGQVIGLGLVIFFKFLSFHVAKGSQ